MNGQTNEEKELIWGACEDMQCCMSCFGGEDIERFIVTYTELQKPTNPVIKRMLRRLDLIRSLSEQLDREMQAFIDDADSIV